MTSGAEMATIAFKPSDPIYIPINKMTINKPNLLTLVILTTPIQNVCSLIYISIIQTFVLFVKKKILALCEHLKLTPI